MRSFNLAINGSREQFAVLAASYLLRIWWAAIGSGDPGAPFQKLFAGIILVNNYFNEAKAILLGSSSVLNGFDELLLAEDLQQQIRRTTSGWILLNARKDGLKKNEINKQNWPWLSSTCLRHCGLHQPTRCSSSSWSHCKVHHGSQLQWCNHHC